MTVTNSGLSGKFPNQEIFGIKGYAEQAENGSGNITVRFPYVPRDGVYKVIDTDGGKSYSIVYGCSHVLGIKRVESVFVLTRAALEKGTKEWTAMQQKVLGVMKSKFNYEGGSSKYWDPTYFTETV